MILSSLLTLTLLAATPEPIGPLLRDHSRALEWAQSLTDEVGPRLAGSEGDPRAVKWAVAKMKELGFVNVRAEPVKVPHWERVAESAQLTAPYRQRLVVAALGGSISTPARGVEAEVIQAADMAALAALTPAQVKGRIVFLNKKMVRQQTGKGYGDTVDVRALGMHAAAEKGAVAVVIRSVGTSDARFAHTGVMHLEPGKKQIPAAALAIPDAELLERLLARGGPVRLKLSLTTRQLKDADSANVIGEVPGATDELVVLGAHLDSWDEGTGAVDNAAGVAVMLEVARAMETRGPKRTLRVVLFANEENGGKGAEGYFAAHQAELPKHHAAFVCDSGAGKAYGFWYHGAPSAEQQLVGVVEPLKALGVTAPAYRYLGHPDVRRLMQAGVPLFAPAQDASRYFDLHHTADDTFDKIDPVEFAQLTAAVGTVVEAVTNLDGPLERVPEERRKEEEGH